MEEILALLRKLDARMDKLDEKTDRMQEDAKAMRVTLDEHSRMLNAMRTNLEMMDAKLDRVETTTASIKQVQDLRRSVGERLTTMGRELLGNE